MADKLPTLLTLLPAVATVYGTMVVGFLLRKAGYFPSSVDVPMTRVVVSVLFPGFIVANLLGQMPGGSVENSGGDTLSILLAPAIGFGSVVLGFGIGYAAAPLIGLTDRRARRAFAFVVGMHNYGFLPLPLADALAAAGLIHPDTVPAILVHNIGVEIAFWSVGIMLASGQIGQFRRDAWKKLLNAPLITIAVVIVLNLTGVADGLARGMPRLNGWLLDTGGFLGGAAIPLALLLIGGAVADVWNEADFRSGLPTILGASVIRLAAMPVLMLTAAYFLTGFGDQTRH
ncbi:MAG: AEC family transporter, partial [Planctomycetota bacterium]